jgi:Zinc carboxypeptidase/Cytosolic carboxypeptidase N-terminal domain
MEIEMAKLGKLLLRYASPLLLCVALASCGGSGSISGDTMRFSADFESGNLPVARQLDQSGLAWELALRNDNDNAALPDSFRTWWYLRADDVPTRSSVQLEFTRLGFPYYFVPVYSYDQKEWHYFDEKDVTLTPGCDVAVPDSCRLVVNKQFSQPTVWIARTFPYTTQDLSAFLNSVSASRYLQAETLGASPHFQKPLQLLTLSDRTVHAPKQTIWIHARTHAAETGPSFVLEGLIRSVLAEDATGRALRQRYVFKIVPMHNVDGVIAGNYRTNTSSINLENQWLPAPGGPYLSAAAPLENRLLNQGGMAPALLDQEAPVVLALNLHSSNSEPDTGAFFFPHFGSDPAVYSAAQRNLWQKQIAFIKMLAGHYDGMIERPPADGGAGFLRSAFPETWWWQNKQDAVNAITLETTYGRAGFDHWISRDDLHNLGTALARTIADMDTLQARSTAAAGADDMSMFRLPFKPEIYSEQE